jgi:hypothetical protein
LRAQGPHPVYAATGIVDWHAESKAKAPGVVTGRSGTIGEVFYVQEDYWPLNTALWVKEFRNVEPLVAYYLLSMLDLKQFNSGAAVPTLNRNDIHGLPILIPPAGLQQHFQNTAGAMLSLVRNLKLTCEKLRLSRDLVLPRLLSGSIAVSEADSQGSFNSNHRSPVEPKMATQKRLAAITISSQKLPLSNNRGLPAEDRMQARVEDRSDLGGEGPPLIDETDRSDVLAVIRQIFSDGQPRTRENAIREVTY